MHYLSLLCPYQNIYALLVIAVPTSKHICITCHCCAHIKTYMHYLSLLCPHQNIHALLVIAVSISKHTGITCHCCVRIKTYMHYLSLLCPYPNKVKGRLHVNSSLPLLFSLFYSSPKAYHACTHSQVNQLFIKHKVCKLLPGFY